MSESISQNANELERPHETEEPDSGDHFSQTSCTVYNTEWINRVHQRTQILLMQILLSI